MKAFGQARPRLPACLRRKLPIGASAIQEKNTTPLRFSIDDVRIRDAKALESVERDQAGAQQGNGYCRMPGSRRKVRKVAFYAIPTTDREKWRLLAHFPGLPIRYIATFDSKAEAEKWASGSEGQDWVRATYGE
jgi:hypothetical protein